MEQNWVPIGLVYVLPSLHHVLFSFTWLTFLPWRWRQKLPCYQSTKLDITFHHFVNLKSYMQRNGISELFNHFVQHWCGMYSQFPAFLLMDEFDMAGVVLCFIISDKMNYSGWNISSELTTAASLFLQRSCGH